MPVDWIEGSALDLPFPAGSVDLVLCQLGLQFFPDQKLAPHEMRRVLSTSGRVALSVYSPIEQTLGANAFVLALDRVLGPNASKIKRGEHSFNAPDELRVLLIEAGFAHVEVQTVWLTTSGMFSEPPFIAALPTFGVDRIMFSVDYPYSSNAKGRAFLDRLPLAPVDMKKFSHGNADALLKLNEGE
jgi:SAM-dependent methyltransferase